VANQVQTRLVPPPAKAGSTTLAGSRKMSGQLNVEDNTIAAAANATAPATNSTPAVRRSPRPALADAMSGCAAPRPVASAALRVVMPAAKAKTMQQMRSGCGDQMETPRPATRSTGSPQRAAGQWRGSQSG